MRIGSGKKSFRQMRCSCVPKSTPSRLTFGIDVGAAATKGLGAANALPTPGMSAAASSDVAPPPQAPGGGRNCSEQQQRTVLAVDRSKGLIMWMVRSTSQTEKACCCVNHTKRGIAQRRRQGLEEPHVQQVG